MISSYEIGTTAEGMVNVENITADPLLPPVVVTRHYDEIVPLASGSARGVGTGSERWLFAYLSVTQRAALRIICPGASAHVFITTRDLESDASWIVYDCTMLWPAQETRELRGYRNFEIEFINRVLVGD